MDFRHHIRQSIDKTSPGLEIGPSFNPIAAKADGYRTHVVDHASQEDLRVKYATHGVDLDRIEKVDLIDDGGSLSRLLPDGERYQWMIASHVIEHIPDLVGFLNRSEEALADSGRLYLIVPDHRRCFDLFRPVSTPGQVIQAHLEQRKVHSVSALFDHYLYAVTKDGAISWADLQPGEIRSMFTAADALRIAKPVTTTYQDCHGWTFTPNSCRLVFAVLASLGLTRLVEDDFHATPAVGIDFLVVLKKAPEAEVASLLPLMTQAAMEGPELDFASPTALGGGCQAAHADEQPASRQPGGSIRSASDGLGPRLRRWLGRAP